MVLTFALGLFSLFTRFERCAYNMGAKWYEVEASGKYVLWKLFTHS